MKKGAIYLFKFGIVDLEESHEAFSWHKQFTQDNSYIFPRTWEVYKKLANDGQLICAKDDSNCYVGLAYFILDESEWEVGGLMVSNSHQGKGIGSTLMRVTLGHLLFEEDPLERNEKIIAHVHSENDDPRWIIEKSLKFNHRQTIQVQGSKLPGLKTDKAGIVHGDEFELKIPDSLAALSSWCSNWNGKLKNQHPAIIEFRTGITADIWALAFLDMAKR
jgi:GNAT superfamily N-acetyltransferase